MFADAVAAARRTGSPYHLAHGLLDQAEYVLSHDTNDGAARADGAAASAEPLIAEARQIAERLGAAPLAARADRLNRPAPAPIGTVP
jgi:hypothetical protein